MIAFLSGLVFLYTVAVSALMFERRRLIRERNYHADQNRILRRGETVPGTASPVTTVPPWSQDSGRVEIRGEEIHLYGNVVIHGTLYSPRSSWTMPNSPGLRSSPPVSMFASEQSASIREAIASDNAASAAGMAKYRSPEKPTSWDRILDNQEDNHGQQVSGESTPQHQDGLGGRGQGVSGPAPTGHDHRPRRRGQKGPREALPSEGVPRAQEGG